MRGNGRRYAIPDGIRVYAVGDVHGRADLLERVFVRVDEIEKGLPPARSVEVFLGDYVDRGPASRDVIELLVSRRRTRRVVCLKGNHEALLADFLRNPDVLANWQYVGGLETIASYGLDPFVRSAAEREQLAARLADAMPPSHRNFIGRLPISFTCGDFFFVHAGVRPGVALEQQREHDLIWIREEFLASEQDLGKIIVHGHTPVPAPEFRSNRINIDTGAFMTGKLTCLRFEGTDIWPV
jgi:serine/threonine protein phosphatase 1